MADFVDATLAEIRKRKRELESLIEEYTRLEEAEAALAHLVSGAARRTRAAGSSARRRATGRPAARKTTAKRKTAAKSTANSGQRGRPKGTGKRQAQAVRIVTASPGITTSEIAKKMGIKPNYLYRVMPELKADGMVSKKGRGWYPAGK